MRSALIYPQQLFLRHPAIEGVDVVLLVEERRSARSIAFMHRQSCCIGLRCDTISIGSNGDGESFHYPVTTEQARGCLEDFLDHRFAQFGDYEDAIDPNETSLFHSVLMPALNIGLISPQEVFDSAIARREQVPLNSLEAFVRQVIGWREYMRGVYRQFGRRQRTRSRCRQPSTTA